MMFGLLATCLFPPLLVCMLGFLMLASLCALEHAYPFPLCNNMLAMLALCHLVRLLCFFASLHPYLYVYECVFVCLFVSSSLVPTYNLVWVCTRLLYKRSRVPFRNFA